MALRIVEAPIVKVIVDSSAASQEIEKRCPRVPTKVSEHAGFIIAKILDEPRVQAGNGEFSVFNPRAVAIYEGDGTGLHKIVRVFCRERDRRQARTAKRRAVEDVVQPRVLPDRPQNTVLDVIHSHRLAFDPDKRLVPWPDGEKPGRYRNVADAGDRISVEHQVDCEL